VAATNKRRATETDRGADGREAGEQAGTGSGTERLRRGAERARDALKGKTGSKQEAAARHRVTETKVSEGRKPPTIGREPDGLGSRKTSAGVRE
jgi:hypothetical protein